MRIQELRVGNWYKWYAEGKYYNYQIVAEDFISDNVRNFEPIELTEEWLLRFSKSKYKETFPDWIKYVHEAQNWYFWNNNKEELIIDL